MLSTKVVCEVYVGPARRTRLSSKEPEGEQKCGRKNAKGENAGGKTAEEGSDERVRERCLKEETTSHGESSETMKRCAAENVVKNGNTCSKNESQVR